MVESWFLEPTSFQTLKCPSWDSEDEWLCCGYNIRAYVFVYQSLFYHSCFRSYENNNKLERNIEFIAEALARHIFNLTTKVSLLCLAWIKSDYCLLLFTLVITCFCKFLCSFLHESHSVWKHGSSSEPRGERRLTALSKATLVDLLLWVEENFATI